MNCKLNKRIQFQTFKEGDCIESEWIHGDTITYKVRGINGAYRIIHFKN